MNIFQKISIHKLSYKTVSEEDLSNLMKLKQIHYKFK